MGQGVCGDGFDIAVVDPGEPVSGCESAFRSDGLSPLGNLIFGSKNSETITGTSGSDRISAKQGDTINAGGGVDFLFPGDGQDTVSGEGGLDLIVDGDDDPDILNGGAGPDRIFSVTGTAHTIDCGAADGATDIVFADPIDILVNCDSDIVVHG